MTPTADIISTRYTKGIVKSCAALSYDEVEARMDDRCMIDPLTSDLRDLSSLAKIMRQRRLERGALTLESATTIFKIDPEPHEPVEIGMYKNGEANQMIEEFMLACNSCVAEKIYSHFPMRSLLRRQPPPSKEKLEELQHKASSVGLDLDISSSKALADSPYIADVTNFIHSDTPLDEEVAQRGTSIYLVQKKIDMLPKLLVEDICSLQPDEERLTFSIIWEMTPTAEIISTRYTKGIIKSCAALSYDEAEARMDDRCMIDPLTSDLRNLSSLAKIMRQRRLERGALTLESATTLFKIDPETHEPVEIGMYKNGEASQMIEEFMLACNSCVAEKIYSHFPMNSLLRRQPPPSKKKLEELQHKASSVGLDLDISSSKALADSLKNHAFGDDQSYNKLIRILTNKCMTKAEYLLSEDLAFAEFHHYGLATSLYTHFTSPVRRYADVIVHRLLAAALEIEKLSPIFQDCSRLTKIIDNLNHQRTIATKANQEAANINRLNYFTKRPMDVEARIMEIKSNGFLVFVHKFGFEEFVYCTSKGEKGREWTIDEAKQRVIKAGTNISYHVFETVMIHIQVVERQPHSRKLLVLSLII